MSTEGAADEEDAAGAEDPVAGAVSTEGGAEEEDAAGAEDPLYSRGIVCLRLDHYTLLAEAFLGEYVRYDGHAASGDVHMGGLMFGAMKVQCT